MIKDYDEKKLEECRKQVNDLIDNGLGCILIITNHGIGIQASKVELMTLLSDLIHRLVYDNKYLTKDEIKYAIKIGLEDNDELKKRIKETVKTGDFRKYLEENKDELDLKALKEMLEFMK